MREHLGGIETVRVNGGRYIMYLYAESNPTWSAASSMLIKDDHELETDFEERRMQTILKDAWERDG